MLHFIVHDYAVVTSTNDEAKALLGQGAGEGVIVRAERQTAGRGRRGRPWISEPGNLYCSLILVPQCPLTQISQLSFVMGLAVGQTILPFLTEPGLLAYKWPNDLLLQGEKVAGILIETELHADQSVQACIVGMGLNVNSPPNHLNYPVTALGRHTKLKLTQDILFSALLKQINHYYDIWRQEGFEPVRVQWMCHAYGLGQDMTIKTGHKEIQGQFMGLSPEGALQLKSRDGFLHEVVSAEIS